MQIDRDAPAIAQGRVEIDAEPQAVWDLLVDFERWPDWQPKVRSMELDGPLATGTVFRWKPGMATITSTIEQLDPPRAVAWTGTATGIEAVHVWRLEPGGAGTVVFTEESWDGWLVRALKGPMRKTLQKEIDAVLEHLKSAAGTTAGA